MGEQEQAVREEFKHRGISNTYYNRVNAVFARVGDQRCEKNRVNCPDGVLTPVVIENFLWKSVYEWEQGAQDSTDDLEPEALAVAMGLVPAAPSPAR